MPTAKKSVAKKSVAKKSSSAAAKQARSTARNRSTTTTPTSDAPASTVTSRPPDSAPVSMAGPVTETAEAVAARETLHSRKKWGSGRDRDANLRKAGLDPVVVARERNRLRNEERNAQS